MDVALSAETLHNQSKIIDIRIADVSGSTKEVIRNRDTVHLTSFSF